MLMSERRLLGFCIYPCYISGWEIHFFVWVEKSLERELASNLMIFPLKKEYPPLAILENSGHYMRCKTLVRWYG